MSVLQSEFAISLITIFYLKIYGLQFSNSCKAHIQNGYGPFFFTSSFIQTFTLNNEPFSLVKRNWIYSDSPLYFRKSENKTRSDTFDTFDVNGSIVEIYNPAHHRKTESGTSIFSGTAFVYAIETLPDSVQVFLTYSNTIIFHFTDNLVIFDLQDNMNMSICFSVIDGIGY